MNVALFRVKLDASEKTPPDPPLDDKVPSWLV